MANTIEYGVVLSTKRRGASAYRQQAADMARVQKEAQGMSRAFATMGTSGQRALAGLSVAAGALGQAWQRARWLVTSALSAIWRLMRRVLIRGLQIAAGAMAAFTAAVVMSVRSFGAYEQQIANAASVTGLMGAELQQAKAALYEFGIKVASESTYTVGQVAQAFYDLNSAGLSVQQSMAATRGVVALAEATLSDLHISTELITRALNIFGLQAKESAAVANTFAAAISASPLTMDRLSEAFSYAAPVAAGFGMTIEETTAAIMALAKGGIVGSRAGTSLRGMLAELSTQGDRGQKILSKYGLTMEDLSVEIHGFAGVIERLRRAQMSTNDIMEVFGRRAGPAALLWIKGGSEELEKMREQVTGTNMAFQLQKLQMDTLAGAWKVFRSAVSGAVTDIGKGLGPALQELLQRLTAVVQRLQETGALKAIGQAIGTLFQPLGEWLAQHGENVGAWILEQKQRVLELADRGREAITRWLSELNEWIEKAKQWFADLKARFEEWVQSGGWANLKRDLGEIADLLKRVAQHWKAIAAIGVGAHVFGPMIGQMAGGILGQLGGRLLGGGLGAVGAAGGAAAGGAAGGAAAGGAAAGGAAIMGPWEQGLGLAAIRGMAGGSISGAGGAAAGGIGLLGIGAVGVALAGLAVELGYLAKSGRTTQRAVKEANDSIANFAKTMPSSFRQALEDVKPTVWETIKGWVMPGWTGKTLAQSREFEKLAAQPVTAAELASRRAALGIDERPKGVTSNGMWFPSAAAQQAYAQQQKAFASLAPVPPAPVAHANPSQNWAAGGGPTIIVRANDEDRIGQVAQDTYDRATGRKRRQAIRGRR